MIFVASGSVKAWKFISVVKKINTHKGTALCSSTSFRTNASAISALVVGNYLML